MEWISNPDAAGAWLRDRLDADWSMHHFLPHGYPAYARVLHPAWVSAEPGGEEHQTTWAEAASAFGTTLHAQASWQHLVRTPAEGDWHTRIAPDGREFSAPSEGRPDTETIAAIVRHLVAHTTTPDDGVAGVWEGWGGMLGFTGTGPSSASLTFSDDETHQRMLQGSFRNLFDNPFQRATWQPGVLSDEISKGPRLELPDRGHVLFSAGASAFLDATWPERAPWGEEPLSLLWPADRAWVLATEIDFDSTLVAGSAELIRALCTDPAIESQPVREGTSLHWDADDINR